MSIGENILNLRKKFGFSQEELANKVMVSRQTISLWETDQTLPTIDNFLRLKEIFNVLYILIIQLIVSFVKVFTRFLNELSN